MWEQNRGEKGPGKAKAFDAEAIELQLQDGYEGFEGWGTSLAWWGHALGGWKDQAQANNVMDLIFDPAKGLGLNIVRYNIGGGENPAYDTMRPGGDIPGFQPEKGRWDWEADANQRAIMQGAIARGVNIVEAFSNSPPYWMTISGSVTGAENGGNNLREDSYDAFADYLTEVVKAYRDRWGITFRSLDPLNEPSSSWWIKGNQQEGSHFDLDKQAEIIRKTADSLQRKGLTGTIVSAPDSNSIDETLGALEIYDTATRQAIGQINAHSYNGTKMKELRALAEQLGKPLWMSEYGTGGDASHSHEDLTSAMELATRIMTDLKIMQPKAWIYWQAVEDEGAQNNWGFIHANFNGEEHYELTKQYYAMAQFSKFIRPGSLIVPTADEQTLAAYDPEAKQLSIVVRNGWIDRKTVIDLTPYHIESAKAEAYRTSATENMQQIDAIPLYENGFEVAYAENSITTVIIKGIELKS
ncbi:glycoside hydrolase [Cohnella suwonensis]|uniref:Glycoside hydrolase n=1 Tax=Cohnella suwonensis TaxID=696072 RepID=A0ABW0LZ93_9BACL